MDDVYKRLLAHNGFSITEREALTRIRRVGGVKRGFIYAVRKRRFGDAWRVVKRDPGVFFDLLLGLPRSLSYRLALRLHRKG